MSGSYFPAQPGATVDGEWPLGDEATWKTALKAEEVDPEDSQAVANTVVRHVTTTLARQAINMNTVSAGYQASDTNLDSVASSLPIKQPRSL